MSLVMDEIMYKAFLKDGVSDETSRAFAHLFASIQGRCELENFLREKFEAIGLLDPDGETIYMENIEDSLEWILMTACFEGKIERKLEGGVFKYRNTELGNQEAIKVIQDLVKDKKTKQTTKRRER